MKIRTRHTILLGGSFALLAVLLATDPAKGVTTGLLLMSIAVGLLAVLFAHLARKALHDYPEADMRNLFRKAGESPVGAGLALVALALISSALLGLFGRAAHAEGLRPPAQAEALLPVLHAEIQREWPDHALPGYFGALVEHETACPRPSMCWKPTAQLKTSREEGAGLGQLTRAWSPDGRTRFDALAEMRAAHPALAELDWATIYQRPDLQLRALVLKSRDDWRWLGQPPLEMVDLAYNAGRGRVTRDRRACAMTSGCDPAQWWGNVELTCTASRAPIYGARSACDISRHHVADVVRERAPKYAGLL